MLAIARPRIIPQKTCSGFVLYMLFRFNAACDAVAARATGPAALMSSRRLILFLIVQMLSLCSLYRGWSPLFVEGCPFWARTHVCKARNRCLLVSSQFD